MIGLVDNTMFGDIDYVKIAVERIRFGYEIGQARGLGALYVCFSGGKDSIVIAELCRLSGVEYTLNYNNTTVDPPELIYFMRANYPQVLWHSPKMGMYGLIAKSSMPPTRLVRYCCAELKEGGGDGLVKITGVRWAESVRRKTTRNAYETYTHNKADKVMLHDNDEGKQAFRSCYSKGGYVVNPIIDWSNGMVWEFIRTRQLPYCKLYDDGYSRLGCIGCPMASTKE